MQTADGRLMRIDKFVAQVCRHPERWAMIEVFELHAIIDCRTIDRAARERARAELLAREIAR